MQGSIGARRAAAGGPPRLVFFAFLPAFVPLALVPDKIIKLGQSPSRVRTSGDCSVQPPARGKLPPEGDFPRPWDRVHLKEGVEEQNFHLVEFF